MGRSYNHWTEAEVAALKEGVARFGVGNWQKIVNDYPVLRQRTGVQLKDKFRNLVKFRHLAANELVAEVPPPRRRSTGGRSPAVSGSAAAAASAGAAPPTQQQQQQQPLPPQQQQQAVAPPLPQPLRSTGQSAPAPSPAQQQAQLAADQAAAQARVQAAQAALHPARQAYVQQLAAASVRRGAAAAAADEAAEAAVRLGSDSPQVQRLAHVAQWWQQQAALAQQLLLATRQMYLQAAEEAQAAQAAANAAVAAVLQAAESMADSLAPRGALPTASGGAAVVANGSGEAAHLPRHSNRRKAALNRKRFLDEEGAEEEHLAVPSRPGSAQGGTGSAAAAAAVAAMDFLPPIDEAAVSGGGGSGGGAGSGGSGKRRKTGAQKRLHEDTRFGIYDDRRYRNAAPAGSQPRRQATPTSSDHTGTAAGADAAGTAAARGGGAGAAARGRGGAGAVARGRRRQRRRPRHLAGEFEGDDDEDLDEEDARMAEAELAEADEDEDEWQRQMRRQEQHDVDCPCGVTYDDGQEMVECEGCGVWAHAACLARYGRLRSNGGRHFCNTCQAGFGSPLPGGTPTAAAAAAAGALSPRGVAVALAARRQAFRNADSFNNDELYDIAAFLENMGPGQKEGGAAGLKSEPEADAAGPGSSDAAARQFEPVGPPLPVWGAKGARRARSQRQPAGAKGAAAQREAWPSAGVTEPAPARRRQRLPPQPPLGSVPGSLAAWQQWQQQQADPLMAAAGLSAGLMARLSGLPQPAAHQAMLPFLPLGPMLPALAGDATAGPLAQTQSAVAAAAAAAAAAAISFSRPWSAVAGDVAGQAEEQGPEAKAAAVAEIMQIVQGTGGGLGLPPPAPRPTLPAAAASALLSSRQPTPSPPIDLMHRSSDLHDADLQDDLHAQDWLAAAASLARADSHPHYQPFPAGGLDGAGGGVATNSQQLPSLGNSPGRLAPLAGVLPLPPLGLQDQQQWLAGMMGSLQPRAGSAGAAGLALRPLGSVPGQGTLPGETHDIQLAAVHRRLAQLAEGAGAAAAAAAAAAGTAAGGGGAGLPPAGRRQSGPISGLDAAQQSDGFGRYRQGSLHSLHQLVAPELEGLQGLTPTASARGAEALLEDDDADAEGPALLISAVQQVEQEEQEQQAAAAEAMAAVVAAAAEQGKAGAGAADKQAAGAPQKGEPLEQQAGPLVGTPADMPAVC